MVVLQPAGRRIEALVCRNMSSPRFSLFGLVDARVSSSSPKLPHHRLPPSPPLIPRGPEPPILVPFSSQTSKPSTSVWTKRRRPARPTLRPPRTSRRHELGRNPAKLDVRFSSSKLSPAMKVDSGRPSSIGCGRRRLEGEAARTRRRRRRRPPAAGTWERKNGEES